MPLWIDMLTYVVYKVFEGEAHPYKENLLKVDGRPKMAELPEIRKKSLKAQSV